MTTTVLLVDDHPVVRSGLRAVLDSGEAVQIVGEAATGEEAITLAAHLRPDVVLCDLRLGKGIDGIATTAALRALDPAPAVLILTTFDRDAEILGA
ncbi:MAG TPA: response regulator transcription factor, partial [Brevibacterium sp.]|nr:response regulator transcription factor [Brevibacterium sp.]